MEKFIVANWKMNKGSLEDLPFLEAISTLEPPPSVTVIITPPYTLLQSAQKILDPTPFYLGAQDCAAHDNGPYTGDISASMLRQCGCTAVILGHSERRHGHKEPSNLIRRKAELALENGLLPIICIGETLDDYNAKKTLSVIEDQINKSIPRQDGTFCIAYEPVWAIGTGIVPSLEEINEAHDTIKKQFKNPKQVLYGGSVTPENARNILSLPTADGLLVGGASLKLDAFKIILEEAARLCA